MEFHREPLMEGERVLSHEDGALGVIHKSVGGDVYEVEDDDGHRWFGQLGADFRLALPEEEDVEP